MRKALYFGTALLVCSAMALAQESDQTSSPSQSGSQATTQNGPAGASAQSGTAVDQGSSMSGQTFQGCLMGSNGNYTLTDSAGVTYQVQGVDAQLSSNVNKQVEVMGTASASASASASGPDSSSAPESNAGTATGSETGNAGGQASSTAQASATKTLNVTSIHKVADSCGGSPGPQ